MVKLFFLNQCFKNRSDRPSPGSWQAERLSKNPLAADHSAYSPLASGFSTTLGKIQKDTHTDMEVAPSTKGRNLKSKSVSSTREWDNRSGKISLKQLLPHYLILVWLEFYANLFWCRDDLGTFRFPESNLGNASQRKGGVLQQACSKPQEQRHGLEW